MDLVEKIEKMLNIKIVSIEEMKEKAYPVFDMINVHGMKLALIKDPLFVVVGDDDVYEKKIEGNFIVVEADGKHILANYSGEPNIEVLRNAGGRSSEEPEKAEEEADQIEEEAGEGGGEDYEEQNKREDDMVKEIVEKIPAWAEGVVVVEKEDGVVVLPIKRSTKKEGAYYASTSWKPLDVRSNVEDLLNHVIMKNGKAARANIYVGDKYINIFVGSSRPRGRYSGRRR
jgi:hypothetical protein